MFQSTRPRGARQGHRYLRDHPGAVSIHAPAWGATDPTGGVQLARHVSIHAPAWGATGSRSHLPQQSLRRFNPRARVGRDAAGSGGMGSRRGFQSTRPRGARPIPCLRSLASSKFQSTRPRGARPATSCASCWRSRRFQSTRPRGARPVRTDRGFNHPADVSIHAPAWGATITVSLPGRAGNCFNPRARVGRDWRPSEERAFRVVVSIHAPAWGATPRPRPRSRLSPRFNPRARVGRDTLAEICRDIQDQVSIHAPAWGATASAGRDWRGDHVSIHAPAWGATLAESGELDVLSDVSIHAPAWGATRSRSTSAAT